MTNEQFNILVTGSNGQLGSEIKAAANNYNYNFFFTNKDNLDITDNKAIENYIFQNNINVVINCAAYTAVDNAETQPELANNINHLAVQNFASIAKDLEVKLIHISTDYVFDGENFRPYTEDDTTNPKSTYGQTKLDGEIALTKINPKNSIIIRTSWVYSSFGKNFVKTMLRLGQEKDSLGVIFDQVGSPTYARDLANAILKIILNLKNKNVELYHYSNEGVASWYDFAKHIMQASGTNCVINPIETSDYPTPATRPHYSILNKSKIKSAFDIEIPYWKDSLNDCIALLGDKSE